MSKPKTPAVHAVLPLSTTGKVNDVFVHEVTGTFVIGSNLHWLLSTAHPTIQVDASGNATIAVTRVPCLELIMPLAAVSDVHAQLGQIIKAQGLPATITPEVSGSMN